MNVLSVSDARANLYKLVDETSSSHQSYLIKGKRHNAVLVSEEDWKALQETLYLISIPGMRESIREGLETPLEETSADINW
jgi:antitoxin YefM